MKNTTEQRTPVEALEDERVRDGEMGSEAIQEADNQITTSTQHSQAVLDFCPSQNKHFFCGTAKKLGCHFCAKPKPREQSPFLRL